MIYGFGINFVSIIVVLVDVDRDSIVFKSIFHASDVVVVVAADVVVVAATDDVVALIDSTIVSVLDDWWRHPIMPYLLFSSCFKLPVLKNFFVNFSSIITR